MNDHKDRNPAWVMLAVVAVIIAAFLLFARCGTPDPGTQYQAPAMPAPTSTPYAPNSPAPTYDPGKLATGDPLHPTQSGSGAGMWKTP